MSFLRVFRSAVAAALATFVINFVANALLARLLGPAEFGRYGFFVALATLLGALTDWGGLRYVHQVHLPSHAADANRALGATLRNVTIAGVAIAALALAPTDIVQRVLGLLGRTSQPVRPAHLLMLGGAVLATGLVANLTSVFIGLSKFPSYNRIGVSVAILSLIVAVALRVRHEQDADYAVWGWVLANGAAAVLAYFLAGLPAPAILSTYTVHGVGLRAFLFNTMALLDGRLGVYLLSAVSADEQVGLYVLSAGLGDMVCRVSSLASFISVPGMARDETEAVVRRLMVQVRRMLALTSAASLGLAFFALVLMRPIYGERFGPAIPVLIAYLPGATVYPSVIHLYSFLSTRGFPWVLHAALGGTAVLNLVLALAVAPAHGAVGAAVAASAAHIAFFMCLVLHMRRKYGAPMNRFIFLQGSDLSWFATTLKGMART